MNYAKRIENLRKKMIEAGMDAVFLASDAAREYFTGLPRGGHGNTPQRHNSAEFSCEIVTHNDVVVLEPQLRSLSYNWRKDQFPVVTKFIEYPDADMTGRLFDSEVTALDLDGKRLGVTRDISSTLTVRLLESHRAVLADASPLVDSLRMIKDSDEIAIMRKVAGITDQIYHDILPMLVPGTPIRDVEREIERLSEGYGCPCTSFPAEVLNYGPKAGPRFGMPYPLIDRDHVVAFDFGFMLDGYCSDFGRTVFLKQPTDEMVRAHELVMEAQRAALACYKPGVTRCKDMNAACRQVMKDAGVDEHFIHRMGHCIGKDVHERPFMSEGEDMLMQPGMTFTDEPSLVYVDKFCIRVEDVVLCTENGFEFLNKVTKDIVVLD